MNKLGVTFYPEVDSSDGFELTDSQDWTIRKVKIRHSHEKVRKDVGELMKTYHNITYTIANYNELRTTAADLFDRIKMKRAREVIEDDEF